MKLILTTALIFCIHFASLAQQNQKTLLAIFAHPDDENQIGAVLAKYSRLGYHVQLVVATDGREGNRVTSIPPGDSLAKVRRQETICACEKLNIQPPLYLHIDRLDTKLGTRQYLEGRKKTMELLNSIIEKMQPQAIITFGPDGEYGHSEHIVTGAIVTEVLLREGWAEKYPLFFPVDVAEDVQDDEDLSYIHKAYINLTVSYTDEDKQKMIDAAGCYVSQFTPAEMAGITRQIKSDKANRRHFRKFAVSKGTLQDF